VGAARHPARHGVSSLDAETAITVRDLEAAESAAGLKYGRRGRLPHGSRPFLDASPARRARPARPDRSLTRGVGLELPSLVSERKISVSAAHGISDLMPLGNLAQLCRPCASDRHQASACNLIEHLHSSHLALRDAERGAGKSSSGVNRCASPAHWMSVQPPSRCCEPTTSPIRAGSSSYGTGLPGKSPTSRSRRRVTRRSPASPVSRGRSSLRRRPRPSAPGMSLHTHLTTAARTGIHSCYTVRVATHASRRSPAGCWFLRRTVFAAGRPTPTYVAADVLARRGGWMHGRLGKTASRGAFRDVRRIPRVRSKGSIARNVACNGRATPAAPG